MKTKLIVHAPNVHTGGGAVLLNTLLQAVDPQAHLLLIKDERMIYSAPTGTRIEVMSVRPRLVSRLFAELRLRRAASSRDTVLAFGNLPPLFRLRAKTVLFVQNRYLVDSSMETKGFSLATRARLLFERLWLRCMINNADRVLVQTPTMSQLAKASLAREAEVAAFCDLHTLSSKATSVGVTDKHHDFVYVSSGEPHKNHIALFDAWALLARQGLRPRLAVTLSPDGNAFLVERIARINAEHGADIVNLGAISKEEVLKSYLQSRALIFPSLYESYGLPLIEAGQLGLPIVASERDYVRDLVAPVETFDPASPRSIARAVVRFLGGPSDIVPPLEAKDFIEHVCWPGT